MKIVSIALSLVAAASLASAAQTLLSQAKKAALEPIPSSKAAQTKLIKAAMSDFSNEKAALGEKLFFDPRLSKSSLISCNSCHNLAIGGSDGQSSAIGHKWTSNPHNLSSPTVYNSIFNKTQFWDGRSPNLADQAKGPMQAAPEMAITPEMAVKRITSMPEYVAMFKKAFPKAKEPVTFDNIAVAIASFEATLVTPSKFDAFLEGNSKALTKNEQAGLKTFIEVGCTTCHTGIGVGGGSMQKFPVIGSYKYANVGDFKGNKDGLVKVPTLRNITQTAPYIHNGAVATLEEAVRIMGETQLGTKLNDAQVASIVTFLKTLDGKKPIVVYPQLPSVTATTPTPDVN